MGRWRAADRDLRWTGQELHTIDSVLKAISLVCKVTEANGRPAVKLSDNPEKATGDPEEIKRYLRIFGDEARVAHKVYV